MGDAIQEAVDNYIAMEADAKVVQLLRAGLLSGISYDRGHWRVDIAPYGFHTGTNLQEVIAKAMEVKCDGRG